MSLLLLFGGLPTDPNGHEILNLAGTTVTHQGDSVYRVVKTAVDGWTNGEAYTANGITGDFVLRIMHNSGGAYATWSASFGVSDHDPTLATSNELEDYGFIIQGSDIYTHRLGVRNIYTSSRMGPWWLGREGGTIKWKSGGSSWATATTDDSQTGASGLSLKLDSSLFHNGASFDLSLLEVMPTAVADSATHAHTASEPSLAAKSSVTVNAASHAHSSTSPSLAAKSSVTVQAASHAHSSTSPTLAAKSAVTVNAATHAQTATSPTLTANTPVTVNAATHAHSSTSPTLAAKSSVGADNATHAHTASSPSLTAGGGIAVQSATHAHAATSPALTPHATVTVDSILHGHTASQPIVTQNTTSVYVAVNSATHAHTARQALLKFHWPIVTEPVEEPWADETAQAGTWAEQTEPTSAWAMPTTPTSTWTTTEPSEGAWT